MAEWRFMLGNERVRFCGQCSQYVYNLSELTGEQAEDLILRHDGRLCVRFYRRQDGTIITNNCPVGLRTLKAKYHSTKATILRAVMTFLAYLGVLWLIESIHVPKPVVMGALIMPDPYPGVPAVTKGEPFIRDKAIYRETPVAHADGGKPVKGEAVVKIVILPSGEVEEATLIKGPERLRDTVEAAARHWKFEPMTEGVSRSGSKARSLSTSATRGPKRSKGCRSWVIETAARVADLIHAGRSSKRG